MVGIRGFPPRTLLLRAVHFKRWFCYRCLWGRSTHSSAGLGLVRFRPFPFLLTIPPIRLLAPQERSPSRVQSEVLLWQGPSRGTWGERPDGQADRAVGRASGQVADLTKRLLPSMPDPLQNCTESLVGNRDF